MIKIINILMVIALFAMLLALSLEEQKFSSKRRLRVMWSTFMSLSIFFGIRDFGLDLEPYRVIFTEFRSLSFSEITPESIFNPTLEPLFVLLITSIKHLGLNYQAFLFASALIPFLLIAHVTEKNSTSPILCTFFFCLLFLFKAADAVRHFVAASIYLFALHLIANKKNFRGYLTIVASCLAHYANLITLIAIPFLRIRWRIGNYLVALLFIGIISVPLGQVLNSATSDQELYLLWKFNYYLHHEEFIEYQNTLHKLILIGLACFYYLLLILVNLSILIKQQKSNLTSFESIILNSQIIGSLIATLFLMLDAFAMATRILLPLAIGSFFLLAHAWRDMGPSRKNSHILYSTIAALLTYNFVVILYNAGIHYNKSPFYLG